MRARLAKVDYQPSAEDLEGDCEVESDGVVTARVGYDSACEDGREKVGDGVGLHDAAGVCYVRPLVTWRMELK
jgi:hypothetical protein